MNIIQKILVVCLFGALSAPVLYAQRSLSHKSVQKHTRHERHREIKRKITEAKKARKRKKNKNISRAAGAAVAAVTYVATSYASDLAVAVLCTDDFGLCGQRVACAVPYAIGFALGYASSCIIEPVANSVDADAEDAESSRWYTSGALSAASMCSCFV